MWESLPWPAITAASGGWLLAFVVLWRTNRKLTDGELVSRREHEQALKAIDVKDAQIAEKDKQLAALEQVGRTVEQFTRGLQQEIKR